jgi:hypothetical protein
LLHRKGKIRDGAPMLNRWRRGSSELIQRRGVLLDLLKREEVRRSEPSTVATKRRKTEEAETHR